MSLENTAITSSPARPGKSSMTRRSDGQSLLRPSLLLSKVPEQHSHHPCGYSAELGTNEITSSNQGEKRKNFFIRKIHSSSNSTKGCLEMLLAPTFTSGFQTLSPALLVARLCPFLPAQLSSCHGTSQHPHSTMLLLRWSLVLYAASQTRKPKRPDKSLH